MDFETAIVGAGPYGLSIAAHLRCAGTPFVIFGTPLESWRQFMPKGMILKSERFASNLWDPRRRFSFKRYCAARAMPYQPVGSPLSLKLFLEYAEWFRQNAVGEVQDEKISEIRKAPHGFTLRLNDGQSVTARRVVLATGHMRFCVMPSELGHLAQPQVVHSSRMADVVSYKGRDVTIVGGGQSALENAALLHEAGAHVRLLVRRSRLEWNMPSKPRPFLQRILEPDAGVASGWRALAISEFPRTFRWCFAPAKRHRFVAGSYGPSGSWWLKDRVNGKVDVWVGTKIEAATLANEQVHLRVSRLDGSVEISTDHVIAGTGFRVDIDQLDYLETNLRLSIAREVSGIPALNSRYETSVPGLYMAGIATAPVFGPIMRFMYGAKHASPTLASAISAAA